MKTDGSDKQKLNEDISGQISIVGDWIYYTVNETISSDILGEFIASVPYRIKIDGSDRQLVS